jgi:predicted house-cleaning noncanonical NTP pyrophosphatase (MazG superfamily)
MTGKLVRDGIPAIIRSSGEHPETHILNDSDYLLELDRKLQEEVTEYLEQNDLSELADVLEVIHAIVKARGSTYEEIESIRIKKQSERGGFEEKIFLSQ